MAPTSVGVDPAGPIQVAVDEERRVIRKAGVRVRRVTRLANLVQPNRTPPRMRLEHALLGAASRGADDAHAIADVASGAYSLLEHRYLTRVERPHGLPTAKRQRRVHPGRTSAYRDVEYLRLSAVVELDGRLGHEETLDRWDDLDRDIESAGLDRGPEAVRTGLPDRSRPGTELRRISRTWCRRSSGASRGPASRGDLARQLDPDPA